MLKSNSLNLSECLQIISGLGNIMDAMKKAQEFTSVAKDLQEQLRSTVIEASVRGGLVTVTMTAQQVPIQVTVSDELLSKGSEEVRVRDCHWQSFA